MDWSALGISLQNALGAHLPKILGALGILVVGWLLAVAARAGMIRLLALLSVDQRIRESTGQGLAVERGIAVGVFWLIPGLPLWIWFTVMKGGWLFTSSLSHLGGLLIGVTAALTAAVYPAASEVVIFVMMVLVLLIRPRGLMGEEGMLS